MFRDKNLKTKQVISAWRDHHSMWENIFWYFVYCSFNTKAFTVINLIMKALTSTGCVITVREDDLCIQSYIFVARLFQMWPIHNVCYINNYELCLCSVCRVHQNSCWCLNEKVLLGPSDKRTVKRNRYQRPLHGHVQGFLVKWSATFAENQRKAPASVFANTYKLWQLKLTVAAKTDSFIILLQCSNVTNTRFAAEGKPCH